MQRIFIKKCFLFMVGSDCCVKRVAKFSQERSKVADDIRPGAEVAETTVDRTMDRVQKKPNSSVDHTPSSESFQVYQSKDFYAAGFDALYRLEGGAFIYIYIYIL
jgi:hypothetical protein